jgi:hypothetical protein
MESKVVLAIDTSSNFIGWSLGHTTKNVLDYKEIGSGLFNLKIVARQDHTYSQLQLSKFTELVKQMAPVIKLCNEHNLEMVIYETSTHGDNKELLNQWNGIFKAFI